LNGASEASHWTAPPDGVPHSLAALAGVAVTTAIASAPALTEQ
jgi:hypothetical protein